jgi:hypothetical protein
MNRASDATAGATILLNTVSLRRVVAETSVDQEVGGSSPQLYQQNK